MICAHQSPQPATTIRHATPATSQRPRGSYRYDVHSPLLNRHVTVYGKRAYAEWLALELEPGVIAYCERPIIDQSRQPPRVVDYWVKKETHEAYRILIRDGEEEARDFSNLCSVSKSLGVAVEFIAPRPFESDLTDQRNRQLMISYLAANSAQVSEEMIAKMLQSARIGFSLGEIERRHSDIEPVLIRTALFLLVRRGELTLPTIAEARICPGTEFGLP